MLRFLKGAYSQKFNRSKKLGGGERKEFKHHSRSKVICCLGNWETGTELLQTLQRMPAEHTESTENDVQESFLLREKK